MFPWIWSSIYYDWKKSETLKIAFLSSSKLIHKSKVFFGLFTFCIIAFDALSLLEFYWITQYVICHVCLLRRCLQGIKLSCNGSWYWNRCGHFNYISDLFLYPSCELVHFLLCQMEKIMCSNVLDRNGYCLLFCYWWELLLGLTPTLSLPHIPVADYSKAILPQWYKHMNRFVHMNHFFPWMIEFGPNGWDYDACFLPDLVHYAFLS